MTGRRFLAYKTEAGRICISHISCLPLFLYASFTAAFISLHTGTQAPRSLFRTARSCARWRFPQWLHPTRQPFSSPAPGWRCQSPPRRTSDASLASATISPMSVVIFSHAGDAQGGHQIKEALRLPCDHADALMGGGSHQEIRSTP